MFSAGGVMSALLMPILVLLFGLAFPLGWVTPPSHQHLAAVLGNPLTRLGLFVLVALSLEHWAHRLRHTLNDAFDIRHLERPIAAVCYASAALGSLAAAYIMWMVP
jgi:fumarate reductase subunit D